MVETVAQKILREAGVTDVIKRKAAWYVEFCNVHNRPPSDQENRAWDAVNASEDSHS